jgi:hypothetical protein
MLRSLAMWRVCAIAPSFVSGWRAFSSVSLRQSIGASRLCVSLLMPATTVQVATGEFQQHMQSHTDAFSQRGFLGGCADEEWPLDGTHPILVAAPLPGPASFEIWLRDDLPPEPAPRLSARPLVLRTMAAQTSAVVRQARSGTRPQSGCGAVTAYLW